jgi:hypothetical protein
MTDPAKSMPTDPPTPRRAALPVVLTVVAVALAVAALRGQGRRWWCACGQPFLWSGDIHTAHNSQHLADPYSLTHVLHGVALYGLLALAWPGGPVAWRFAVTVAIEALWEVVENSAVVIDRYRTATLALGYEGDSIANSLGDIACCAAGFWLARRLGLRWSVVFFLATEAVLLVWIRDDLALNVLMLVYPLEAVKTWQMGP